MTSRGYDIGNISAVVDMIDKYVREGVPDDLRPTFKPKIIECLRENEQLDDLSFKWVIRQIDSHAHYSVEGMVDELEDFKILLLIDILLEDGRQILKTNKGFHDYKQAVVDFLYKYNKCNPEVLDDKKEEIEDREASFKGIVAVRETLEDLKRQLRNSWGVYNEKE